MGEICCDFTVKLAEPGSCCAVREGQDVVSCSVEVTFTVVVPKPAMGCHYFLFCVGTRILVPVALWHKKSKNLMLCS